MADKNTTQATHITELSVGISGVQEQLQKVRDDIEATAKFAQENPIDLIGGSSKSGGVSGFTATRNSIESLNLSYKNFLNTLAKSKLDDSVIGSLKNRAKEAAEKVVNLGNAVSHSGKVTKENMKAYQDLSSDLKTMKGELKDAETKAIETGEGFKQLGEGAKAAGTGFGDFIKKLSDKAKWLVAYQFIVMIQNAFSQVISTIKGTEDAVIELQRVLNDSSLSNSAISDALYDIAYRYGQTFENVQETAVLFAQTGMDFNEVLQATEATMLGLNTAELEVTTATQGLIAVMSQFNLDASELNDVIDKINITADNFPVTSEKIVAALQRAGSAAYNYGLTLEETISIITALSEVTGRAGANLGTALNSLINFSMKPESLKAFSDYLGGISLARLDVLDVWTLLGNSIKDGGEELGKLMAESAEFADLFSEEMAEAVGAMDEYTAAVGNAEGVYQTAGVYRKNYFIALLNNIETVTDALQNMNDATGYSIEENEKYMNTLTASWNQLVVVAQELAVQFGEIGFLNILKILTDIATQTLRVSKNFGGLNTLLVATLALFAAVKRQKLESAFSKISSAVQFAQGVFRLFNDVLATTGSVATATSVSLKVLFASNPVGWIAAGISAFVGIAGAMENAKIKSEEYRQELIQLGQEAKIQTENVSSAYTKFLEETKDVVSADDIKKASYAVFESLGYSENDANVLINRYHGVNEALEIVLDNMNKLNKQAAEDALDASEVNVQNKMQEALNKVYGAFYSTIEEAEEFRKIIWDTTKYENRYVGFLDQMKKKQAELEAQFTSEELKNNNVYQMLLKYIPELEKELIQFNLDSDTVELYGDTWEETQNKMKKAGEAATQTNKEINGLDLDGVKLEVEQLGEAYDRANEKIDKFQKSYSSLIDIVAEYNENGIMTAEMLQTLLELEPEYIDLLNVKNGEIALNGEKLDELIGKNDEYMQQLVAMKIAEEAETLALELHEVAIGNKTLAEVKSAATTAVLSNELYKAILGEIQGTNTTNELAVAMENLAKKTGVTGEVFSYLESTVNGYVKSYSDLLSLIEKNNLDTFFKDTGTVDNPERKALEEEVKSWKRQKDALKDSYETQIKEIQKLKKEKEDYYDQEIDKLKEVEKNNDKINKQLDYYADRQKILTNIEQAKSRSGVEWRQKEVEYQQDLADLDNDWRKTLAEWDIDDQIDEFQRLKEEQSDFYDSEIDRLKELQDTAVKTIEETITTLQDKINELPAKISGAGAAGYKVIYDEAAEETDKFVSETEEKVDNSAKTWYDSFKTEFYNKLVEQFPQLATIFDSDVYTPITNKMNEMWNNASRIYDKMEEIKKSGWLGAFSLPTGVGLPNTVKQNMLHELSNYKSGPLRIQPTSSNGNSTNNITLNMNVNNIDSPQDADATARKAVDLLTDKLKSMPTR